MASKKLELSIICGKNERVAPLLDGEVEVEGVDLIHTKSDPSETFWRQLNFGEFEIAEMSMSSYLIARDQGADMVMIPVYPTRRWFHTELMMHVDAGIEDPSRWAVVVSVARSGRRLRDPDKGLVVAVAHACAS